MFDHLTLTVQDYEKSLAFYAKVLATLGMKLLYEEKGIVTGFGVDRPVFWVGASDARHEVSRNVHIAFTCENNEQVHAFYAAAMAAGAKDNGAPGPRPQYDEKYYAAFVFDLDGNNIEVICRN
jgi:catechol 2,3-dioxygenase-like lactoylglutathione lyase family enzyme